MTKQQTQRSLARSIGLSESAISLLIAGKRTPSLSTLTRLARLWRTDLNGALRQLKRRHTKTEKTANG